MNAPQCGGCHCEDYFTFLFFLVLLLFCLIDCFVLCLRLTELATPQAKPNLDVEIFYTKLKNIYEFQRDL